MLVLSRKVGERIVIEGGIEIILVALRSTQARIGINAPRNTIIDREEIAALRRADGECQRLAALDAVEQQAIEACVRVAEAAGEMWHGTGAVAPAHLAHTECVRIGKQIIAARKEAAARAVNGNEFAGSDVDSNSNSNSDGAQLIRKAEESEVIS